ncbi:MAG: hypothetical protein JRE23_03250 [Deltaproteobacteria bacterium]|nr:hypothetical protein [Deltaproteobacteria bacterium]
MRIPKDPWFWVALLIMLLMLTVGIREAHSWVSWTRLSDVGLQTEVKLTGCGNGTYVVQSKERQCSLIYKEIDLTGSYINIKRIPLNQDGECVCPEGD